ncbi:MAG TPA: hypothetical protein VHN14_28555 [Kofleriaceae bacterium]|nr:hypothetical protein [Kofleriaceae bacterium]
MTNVDRRYHLPDRARESGAVLDRAQHRAQPRALPWNGRLGTSGDIHD